MKSCSSVSALHGANSLESPKQSGYFFSVHSAQLWKSAICEICETNPAAQKKKCIPDTKASRIANTYFIHIFHRVGRRAAQLWADTRFSWSDLTRQPGLVAARTSSVGWHQGFQKKTLREFQPAFPSRLERTGDSLASPAVTTTTTNVYPKNPDPSLIDAGPIFGEGGTSPDFFPLVIIGA